jgi:hypothetical protein
LENGGIGLGDYKLTRKGFVTLALLIVGVIVASILGTIYLAVLSFLFLTTLLGLTLYEVFFNR